MALKWRERVACQNELEIDKKRLIPETRLTTSKGSVEEETCREREREGWLRHEAYTAVGRKGGVGKPRVWPRGRLVSLPYLSCVP